MISLDLDELDSVFLGRWFWSTRRMAFARFRASDHLVEFSQTNDLRRRVEMTLSKSGIDSPIGPIRLLTQLRYFGFAMNPVSFFYCYDEAGGRVIAIIAEVNNTPWGEQHCYVIESDSKEIASGKNIQADEIDKTFHVSPFMSMQMSYRMAFSIPDKNLAVKIENHLDQPDENGESKILDVSMALKRKPITGWSLALMLAKYPLYSFKVFAAIYWQALRIYLKKIPFVSHPGSKPDSNDSNRPLDSGEELEPCDQLHEDQNTSEPESLLVS